MDIILTNAGGQPIYDQIVSQIKAQILSGKLKEGDALPSLRTLAKDLRISVITTKRAYDELEREGFINTVAGKGCFVAAKNTEMLREEYLRQIEDYLQKAACLAAATGISPGELADMLHLITEEESL